MSRIRESRLEALRSAPLDSWVALSDDESRVVGLGKTYDEAVRESENAGVHDPLIVKTPVKWSSFSV
jgi:hypothetical protein